MPINKSRNKAIAIGLGYAINNFNQNIIVTRNQMEFLNIISLM